MHIVAALLSYPPARYIGSELSTATLLEAMVGRGHTAAVVVGERRYSSKGYHRNGIEVRHRRDYRRVGVPDVVLCHVDAYVHAVPIARRAKAPLVGICHNGEPSVASGLRLARPDLVCVVAPWLRRHLDQPNALVVRPFTDVDVAPTHGDAVTLIGLSEAKGVGVFWSLAEAMPDVKFLGVKGGYSPQTSGPALPNVTLLPHVPADDMDERIWSRTRVLLMPSQRESWGRTAVEASARGIPVIAAPTPGLCESLGPAGTFVDRDDLAGWQSAVRRLLDGRRWGAASRRSIAHARSLHLDDDVTAFCDAVENLRRG